MDFTDEEIAEYMESFRIIDKDGDGTISVKELSTMLHQLGLQPTEDEVQKMFNDVDTDGNGTIDFDEFLAMMEKTKQGGVNDKEEQLRETFNQIDKDSSGFITADELHDWLTALGENLTQDEIQEMICEADRDGDGKVNYEGQPVVQHLMQFIYCAPFPPSRI